MAKPAKKVALQSKPEAPMDFSHMSNEERFLVFIAPRIGTAAASKMFRLDVKSVEKHWARMYPSKSMPVSLDITEEASDAQGKGQAPV